MPRGRRPARSTSRAEGWGYRRDWLPAQHNMHGVASSATAVRVGHVAPSTKKS